MKKMEFVSLLTVLMLCLALILSGCNAKAPTTTGGSTSSGPTDAPKTEDKKEGPEWTLLEPLNKEPGKLTLPRSNYIKYPVEGADGITLRYWMPLPSNVSKKSATVNETEWARIWQEMTGIKVEFIHPTQGSENEEFSVLIAGNLLPDIIEWEWTTSYPGGPAAAEEEGVLINLDDYITPTGPAADLWHYLQDNPSVDRQVKNDAGSYYCFPFIRGDKYLQTTSGLFYRADLFKKAGITKTPVTIDDWTDALTKLKAIGVQKPMVMQSIDNLQSGTMNAYLIRPGMYVDHETGKIKFGFMEEGYKKWMLQMNEWVKAGLLDPDVLTSDRTTLETYIMTGVGAATYGAGGGYMGSFLTIAKQEPDKYGTDFDLAAANFPVLNEGDPVMYGGASYDYATTSKASAVITADCKYPEIAAKFLNFAYSEKGHYAINFGEEGKAYTMVNGEPVYTDIIMKNPEGLTVAVAMAHWGRANMSGAFVQDPRYIFQYYETEQQKQALHIWNDYNDSQKTLIPPITLTQEESRRFAALNSQVDTYVKEQRARFYTMEGDIAAEWDNYVKTLKELGVEEMITIYQAALDRYNAR